MADIAKARVPVVFDKAAIAKDANDAIGPAFEGAAKNAAKLAAGVFASTKLIDVGKAGFDELAQSQAVAAQTSVALRTETNITAGDIDNLGQSMLDLAGFDDEAARSAANVLLRFGAIHDAGTLKRVETDAADLAKTMGTDLPSAAQTLGQILQDPENAARKLRPIIGSLTDAQKESIKAFTDQGDAAGAQGVILGILEQRIGGAAKAYGDTLGGSLDKAKENITNAKASLVEGLAPALEAGADLASKAANAIEELPGPLRTVASVAVGAGVALAGIAQPIAGLIGSFNSLKAARILSAAAADGETASETASVVAKTAGVTANEALTVTAGESAAATGGQALALDAVAVSGGVAAAGLEEASFAAGALDVALGPIGIGLAAVAAAVAVLQFSDALSGGRDDAKEAASATDGLTAALKANTQESQNAAFSQLLFGDKATDAGKSVGLALQGAHVPLKVFFDEVKRGTSDLGDLQHNSKEFAGGTLAALRLAAQGGSQFAQTLVTAADAGKLTEAQLTEIVHTANTYSGKLGDLKHDTDAATTASTELGIAGDGLKDTSGVDAQKAHMDSLKLSADSAKSALESIVQAQRGLLSADIRVASGPDSIANANARVAEARAKLGTGKNDAENAQLQRDFNQAVRDATSATNDYAQATAEQAAQQAEARGEHLSSEDALTIYSDKLHELAASTTDGDIHAGLGFLIADLDATKGAADNAAAAIQSITDKQTSIDSALTGISGIAAAAKLAQDIKNSEDFNIAVALGEGHAMGGYAPAGQAFRHGEQGDFELAVLGDGVSRLSQDAFVLDHQHSMQLVGAGSGGGGPALVVNGGIQALNVDDAIYKLQVQAMKASSRRRFSN